jgi:hypothetical protein
MERWLLISNCHTYPFTNCFNLLSPDIIVEGIDIWLYKSKIAEICGGMGHYHRVLIHPEIETIEGTHFTHAKNVTRLPSVFFEAYHPDFTYVVTEGRLIPGGLSDYHSIIAFAAFQHGLDVDQAKALYRGDTYEAAGYFDIWHSGRQNLISYFREYDIEVDGMLVQWARGNAFMYSMNHPHMRVVYDIARQFLKNLGMAVHSANLIPPDSLFGGPGLPVYNEIAETLSIPGSYLFKPAEKYHYETLDQFIENSYRSYSAIETPLLIMTGYEARYERIAARIRGEA